jgi:hypothetical protein
MSDMQNDRPPPGTTEGETGPEGPDSAESGDEYARRAAR